MKRVYIFYSGLVQGVGFRFTTRTIAKQLNLSGWVRNLPDGKVEIVCEGKEEELKQLLNKIKTSHVGKHISNEEISWMPATGEFEDFEINFF